jgi:hypothetical protein
MNKVVHPYINEYVKEDVKNKSFLLWKNEIEDIVKIYTKCSLDDLPDKQYRIWFDSKKVDPNDAAMVILDDFNNLQEYLNYHDSK